jgi:hypothetical protein
MKYKKSTIVLVAFIVIVVFFLNKGEVNGEDDTGEYDTFAKCLEDSGAKFYGAYWCSHCNNQKDMFGASAKKIPYIECSLPNRAGQTSICAQAEINGYPTWEFPDGSRQSGSLSLNVLAERSGCDLVKD